MKARYRSSGGFLDSLIPDPIKKMIKTVEDFSPHLSRESKEGKSDERPFEFHTPHTMGTRRAAQDLNKLATDAKKVATDLGPKQAEIRITRITPSTQESYLGPKQSSLGAQREKTKPHARVNRAEADEWTRKLNAQAGPYKSSALRKGGSASLKEDILKKKVPRKNNSGKNSFFED